MCPASTPAEGDPGGLGGAPRHYLDDLIASAQLWFRTVRRGVGRIAQ